MPSGSTPDIPSTLSIQFPPPIPANAGIVISGYNPDNSSESKYNYDGTITLAASHLDANGINHIGVSDSPTMAAMVAKFNSMTGGQDVILNSYGITDISPTGAASGVDPDNASDEYFIEGSAVTNFVGGQAATAGPYVETFVSNGGSFIANGEEFTD